MKIIPVITDRMTLTTGYKNIIDDSTNDEYI